MDDPNGLVAARTGQMARQTEKRLAQDKAWDLWLDCVSQTEIAERLGVPQNTISGWISKRERSSEIDSPPASRQHFDVWSFAADDDSAGAPSYFGHLPPQIVQNLLWLYTEPSDIVVDSQRCHARRNFRTVGAELSP